VQQERYNNRTFEPELVDNYRALLKWHSPTRGSPSPQGDYGGGKA